MTFRLLGDGLPVNQIGGLEFYPRALSVAFSPSDIAGLEMWLKADAGTFQDVAKTTSAVSDGDVIGAWEDQSGNGNDALQAVTANKPLLKLSIVNGLPVVRFDGANDTLATAAFAVELIQPHTTFVVMEMRNVEGDLAYVHDGIALNKELVLRSRTGGVPDDWRLFAGSSLTNGTAVKNAVTLIGIEWNGGSTEMWENGVSQISGNAGGDELTGITLASQFNSTGFLDGDVVEFILYNAVLSIIDRLAVEDYLNARYNIFPVQKQPAEIADMKLWFKADTGTFQDTAKTTPAAADGDVIGAWADQSGNDNDALQAVTANKPLLKLNIVNGLPVTRFDGVNDLMATADFGGDLAQPTTIFIVFEIRNAEDDRGDIYDGIDVNKRHSLFSIAAGAPDPWRFNGGLSVTGTDAAIKNEFISVTIEFNGASSEAWQNGVSYATGDVGSDDLSGLTLGQVVAAVGPLDGDIAEVILYNALLSSADRLAIERYINKRYLIY